MSRLTADLTGTGRNPLAPRPADRPFLMTDAASGERRGAVAETVFYNGACPVCRAEIGHYRGLTGEGRLRYHDISDDPTTLARLGVDEEDQRRRLHVVTEDGRLLVGVDAFLALWRTLPRYRWIARLVGSPGLRPAAGWLYDRVLAPALYRRDRRRRGLGRPG